jgi:hypothetical protein
MTRHAMLFAAASVVLTAILSAGGASAQMLKREPPMGALKEGQTVLVDDGACPKGQVRRVTGGNHTAVGGAKQVRRSSSCVARQGGG